MIPQSPGSDDNTNELNQGRIEDSNELTDSYWNSTQTKKSCKFLPSNISESYDYRSWISSMISELSQPGQCKQASIYCTPSMSRSKIKIDKSYGKTLTIKGKKGFLYREICPICLGQFHEIRGNLPCSHIFCFQCIEQWAANSSKCPCCRATFSQIQKIDKNNHKQIIQVPQRQAVFEEADYYICYNCGRGDDQHVLLICDSCDFYCCHIYCDPVLRSNIPQGDWYCKYCEERINRQNNSSFNLDVSSVGPVHQENTILDQSMESSHQKPVAARTRSRINQPNARLLQRLRRRR